MATTANLLGLPSTLGATIVQSTTLQIQSAAFDDMSWEAAKSFVSKRGYDYFIDTPLRSEKPLSTWAFYMRNNMATVNANWSTLVGIYTSTQKVVRGAGDKFSPTRTRVKAYVWDAIEINCEADGTYVEVVVNDCGTTILSDPKASGMLIPVSYHQSMQQAQAFVWKVVAANVPLFDPALLAQGGLYPIR
jgi:hypothetical protein